MNAEAIQMEAMMINTMLHRRKLGARLAKDAGGVLELAIAPAFYIYKLEVDDGQPINAAWVRSKVGILDVGTYTTDYALSDGLEYIAKGSGSHTAAMATVWRATRDAIRREWGLDYPLHKVDDFMRDGYTVMVEGHNRSILPMVEPALDALAQQVIAGARERWGKARDFARILVTGGGAEYVGDQVQVVYPHCQVLRDPNLGNVRGFYKYAIRKFGK